MRKTYALQYRVYLPYGMLCSMPSSGDTVTLNLWMSVSPFRKLYGYREFVLRFGGKQSSTRRWFLFRWEWLNKLLNKIYE